MQQARELIAKEFDAVNQLIIENLHSNVPLVGNIGHYIVEAGGKRMRPMLTLLSGGACGNLNPNHITLATAIEFIHTATLLHDDVVDLSTLRRGRPTANAEWGNAPSVLVGDFLYSRAFQLLVTLGNSEVMALIAGTTNTVAEGEVLQLTKAGDPSTSEEEYFQVIENKTAVLFAAASAGGAMLAGVDKEQVSQYYQYGLNLGLAFQLVDDALDYTGNAEDMGKNVGDDLAEGKPTLPLIFTMSNGSDEQKAKTRDAISHKSTENIDQIIDAVTQSGALDYTLDQAKKKGILAQQALKEIGENPYKIALYRIIELSIERNC
ncbi:MAG: polyprenyl synthetase family protein [Spongiibacteraceae bacterium]